MESHKSRAPIMTQDPFALAIVVSFKSLQVFKPKYHGSFNLEIANGTVMKPLEKCLPM